LNTSTSSTTNYKTAPTGNSTTGSPYLTTASAAAYNSLSIDTSSANGANFLSLNGIVTLASAGLLMTGNNDFTIQGGTQLGANNNGVIVNQMGTGTLTINSLIGSGSTLLVKAGTGTLILGGANTYTGATLINAGILKLGATGSGANGPLGTIAGSTTVTGTGAALDLGGFTLATAEPLTLKGTGIAGGGALMNSGSAATYSGLITLGSDASIVANNDITLSNVGTITGAGFGLTLAGTSSDSKLASIIGTGAGTVTKSGSGTWTLSANNTYSGATMINEGTLVGVVGGSCSNSAVTVASAGALGISVTDPNKKWSCASLALNSGSQLKFDFTGTTPSASEAPLNILGNLTFSETSTIVVSPRTTTPGTYPLLTVGGTAPTSSLPKLSGVTGKLFWNDKTLWVTIVPSGTMIRFW
jgi:fibronectin-binding autotransporter adhesin